MFLDIVKFLLIYLAKRWLAVVINSLTTPCISLTTCGLAAASYLFAVDPSVCIDLTDYFLLIDKRIIVISHRIRELA